MASNFLFSQPYLYKDKEHASCMMKRIHGCWNDGKYSDVTLQIDEHMIKSHKVILASFSEYFRGLFDMARVAGTQTVCKDNTEKHVLKDVDYNSFQLLLKFAYTGEVEITDENCQRLLICADYFGVLGVVCACEDFMFTNINASNCIDLIKFTDKFSFETLQNRTLEYIGNNFEKVMVTEEFLSLPLEIFLKLCQFKDLIILRKKIPVSEMRQELCLLKSALRFANSKLEAERENILVQLLRVIRLPVIDEMTLSEELEKWPDLRSLPSVKRLIELAIEIVPSDSVRSDIPVFWDSSRKLSYQSSFRSRRKFGEGFTPGDSEDDEIEDPIAGGFTTTEYDDSSEIGFDDRIQQITLWIGRVDAAESLSGFKVKYTSGKEFKYGGKGSAARYYVGEYTVDLEEDEVIIKVTGLSQCLVSSITFHTNFGRKHGPFGGRNGRKFTATLAKDEKEWSRFASRSSTSKRKDEKDIIHGYLLAFSLTSVTWEYEFAITHLRFIWTRFETLSDDES